MRWRRQPEAVHVAVAIAAVAVVTLVLGPWLRVANTATISITYLIVVLVA